MVTGLTLFARHFRGHGDQYALIGGTACDLVLDAAGLPFRSTKDLDIVLLLTADFTDFAASLWEFLTAGGYGSLEAAPDRRCFYRFQRPANQEYPAMIELFSRVPDALAIDDDAHLTPIPVDGSVQSLSAILLDTDYSEMIDAGRVHFPLEGEADLAVSCVAASGLIPLKAKAWLDLTERKDRGDSVDSGDIKKHFRDVYRLSQVVDPGDPVQLPSSVAVDLSSFLAMADAEAFDPAAIGLRNISRDEIHSTLRAVYKL